MSFVQQKYCFWKANFIISQKVLIYWYWYFQYFLNFKNIEVLANQYFFWKYWVFVLKYFKNVLVKGLIRCNLHHSHALLSKNTKCSITFQPFSKLNNKNIIVCYDTLLALLVSGFINIKRCNVPPLLLNNSSKPTKFQNSSYVFENNIILLNFPPFKMMTCGIGNLSKPKWQTDLIESWPPNAQSIMDQQA